MQKLQKYPLMLKIMETPIDLENKAMNLMI